MAGDHVDPTSMRLNRYIEEANLARESLQDRFRYGAPFTLVFLPEPG
jgi:hypothetical protein